MTFDNLLSELKNASGTVQAIATKLNIQLPSQFPQQIVKLNECLKIYNTCKTGIATIVLDAKQGLSLESLTKLTMDVDKTWDEFAKEYNNLFNRSTLTQQTNVLETFAKTYFGNNVFKTGSIIKNETPNILSGILTFKSGIESFEGSYRNPREAANKIRQGIDNIVGATEQIAQSLNQIYTLIKGKGMSNNALGYPILDTLSNLHKNKVLATGLAITNIADGLDVLEEGKLFVDAVRTGDIKEVIGAGEVFVDSVEKMTKNTSSMLQSPSSFSNIRNIKSSLNNQDSSINKSQCKQQETDKQGTDKADSYVCSGATLKCSFGDKSSKLRVYPERTVFLTEQPMANISDHTAMYNIWPFGKCHTVNYPSTGAATAAAHGKLTPMPCVPGTVTKWVNAKNDYIIKGEATLLRSSYCRCQWGGIITIIDDGQIHTGSPNLELQKREKTEDWNKKECEKTIANNALLDGIQTVLDIAGFIPGVGAIPDLLNAAIYAFRGDNINAGLSLLAAVPGIGDIAAASKIANKGVKVAKAATKLSKIVGITSKSQRKAILIKEAKNFISIDISIKKLENVGLSKDEIDFFMKKVRHFRREVAYDVYSKSPNINMFNIESHLNAIDFSSPIEIVKKKRGEKIGMYVNKDIRGNLANPGNYAFEISPGKNIPTPEQLGVVKRGIQRVEYPIPGKNQKKPRKNNYIFKKEYHEIEISQDVICIKSKSRKITDTWSDNLHSQKVPGGAEQIFITNKSLLKIIK